MNTDKKINNRYFYNGLMIIISSPSGAGKTTLCKKILLTDDNIFLSISYTTRKKRKSEEDGRDYKFITKNKFIKMKKNNLLLESAKVFGNNYGTPAKDILRKIKQNPDYIIHVALDNNKIVGSTTLFIEQKFIHDGGRVGHIEDVVVRKDYEGRGIGMKLVISLLNCAKEKNCYKTN